LRNQNLRRRHWNPAIAQVGLTGFTPHDLRHTAVSLSIAAGADLKALQRLVGHRSATTTLDVYGEVLDQTLVSVADRLDEAYTASSVSSTCADVSSTVRSRPRSDR
jgi:integrase